MKLPPDSPTVALLPWGDVIEDYLDAIHLTFEEFATEMTGGWLFGYVDALRAAGVRTVIVCVSARQGGADGRAPARFVHAPTGAPLYAIPAAPAYRRLRCIHPHPYRPPAAFRDAAAHPAGWLAAEAMGYLATPLRPLAGILRREQCRAILCQEYEDPRFDACTLLGRRLGLPVYATFQGGDWQRARIERAIRPLTLRMAAGLLVPAGRERERIQSRYGLPPAKIDATPNPLDTGLWKPVANREASRQTLGFAADALIVAWHGRIERQHKGLDVLLEAWKGLQERFPHPERLRLLLAGDGGDAPWLRGALAALPHPERVRWVDRFVRDREEMRRFLSAADVYVFPSRHEGFAVAPLEAMACGLPVVAADAPGVRDLLGHPPAGVLVPTADPDAMADALRELLEDPARRTRLGAEALGRVQETFSLPQVGAALRRRLFPPAGPMPQRRAAASPAEEALTT